MSRIRILGIDPGFANIGIFGLTRLSPGVKAEYSRLILTEKMNEGTEGQYQDELRRLDQIEAEFVVALDEFKPDVVAAERYASLRSAQVTRQLALAFGGMHALVRRRGLPFFIFDPEEIKFEMCGDRKAKKPKMVKALKSLFPAFKGWPKVTGKIRAGVAITHVVDAAGAAVLASKLDLDARLNKPRFVVTEVTEAPPASPS